MRDWFLYRDKIKHYFCEKNMETPWKKRKMKCSGLETNFFVEFFYWA